MEILSSRIMLRPVNGERTLAFYRDVLGLAVFREFPGGTVFYLGQGLLEISGSAQDAPTEATQLWLQVRDLAATARDLAEHGVTPVREPRREPWGLDEMWIADPDGRRIAIIEVPPGHPIRTDVRADQR